VKRRPVGVPWWGEVCLSVRTPWDRAYSAGVLSCIGAIARAPERELMRKSEGCWCQGGPLWLAETLCFTYPPSPSENDEEIVHLSITQRWRLAFALISLS